MKNFLLSIMTVIISTSSFGQKENRVKINYSYMNSLFFEHEDIGNVLYSEYFGVNKVGVSYNRRLYKWFRIETGFDFSFSDYNTDFQATPNAVDRDDKLYMASFPIILSIEFAKYFYINTGLSIDLQTNEPQESDKQSGIGGLLGIGAKYDYQDYTFSIGIENQRKRIKSFTEKDVFPNYLHQYGVGVSLGYNF